MVVILATWEGLEGLALFRQYYVLESSLGLGLGTRVHFQLHPLLTTRVGKLAAFSGWQVFFHLHEVVLSISEDLSGYMIPPFMTQLCNI